MRTNSFLAGLVLSAITFGPARAQLADAAGSKDHPLIKRYEGSVIIGYDFREFGDRVILMGPVKGAGPGKRNTLIPTDSQRIEGRTTRLLYVSPGGRSPLEVLRNYEQELGKSGFETLYRCSRNECGGDRDGWLGQYYLYPMDHRLTNTPSAGRSPGEISQFALNGATDQQYFAAKRTSAEGDIVVSVYAAKGEFERHKDTFGRTIVLLDVVETVPMETNMVTVDADAMARDIAASGHVALYGIYFDTDRADIKPESAATIEEIARLLKQDASLAMYVVGHTDNAGEYAYNVGLSERRAAAVVAELTGKHRIAPSRLKPAGAGPLAPVAPNDTDGGRAKNRRVELVKR